MAVESFEAWVIHKKPLGDTSLLTILFTREKGMIHSVYKGGRSPKKFSFLQPLTPLWVGMEVRKQDKYYIRSIENASSPISMSSKNTLFSSFYMNELLYYSLRPLDAHETLFDSYSKTLRALSGVHDMLKVEILVRGFEKSLLEACGRMFSFKQVAYSDDAIIPSQKYIFFANSGFVPAEDGPLLGRDILACGKDILDEDKSVLRTAKFVMRQAIDCLIEGKALKSRQLLFG